eukprot:82350_1
MILEYIVSKINTSNKNEREEILKIINLMTIIKFLFEPDKKGHPKKECVEILEYIIDTFMLQIQQDFFDEDKDAKTEYLDMVKQRGKMDYISLDSNIDQIFRVLIFKLKEDDIKEIITDRLEEWNKNPNDSKRTKALFSICEELKILIKISIHRSYNPINKAIQFAQMFKNKIEDHKRIEVELDEIIEFIQQQ